jgi:nicotinamidase-related amidase
MLNRPEYSGQRNWYWTEVFSSLIPILVLIDLQQEYRSTARALCLNNIDSAIANCRLALKHARALGLPVAFTRLALGSAFFNAATPFHGWIEGFHPNGSDYIFERNKLSCYASDNFLNVVSKSGGNIVIAGFSGDGACLATAVEAFHRDHSVTFLQDASASHPIGALNPEESHSVTTSLLSQFGTAVDTAAWMESTRTLVVSRE